MMEHIPEPDVETVLAVIAGAVRHCVLFVIARDEDRDGAEVGQVLHMTRKDKQWWDDCLLRHFARVTTLRYEPDDESAYCCIAWKC
jgi:hypothetical protein